MNSLRLAGLMMLAVLASQRAHARPGPFGFWPAYFGTGAVNARWGIWAEAQYRAYDFALDGEQLLLRSAVTYNIRPDVQLAAGYAYVRSEPYIAGTDAKRVTVEHRPYQQLILRGRYGRLYLTHRYRLEERFLADGLFKVRFRYFLGGALCLNAKELQKGTAYLSAYNEIFIHDRTPHYDRNRIYAGAGYTFGKGLRVEAGPMWQVLEGASRPQLQLMVWHSFRF